jgi:predicted DNA-binding transcriptional regulator AlpA
VRPVELARGTLLWDRRDIDRWIDTMKADNVEMTRDDILDRL